MISKQVVRNLLQTSSSWQHDLKKEYGRLPKTECRREARCCSMLPEMTFVEILPIIQRLMDLPTSDRRQLIQNIIEYFFINPVEITSCPFLNGQDCLIYTDRAFGCRAYGLWSLSYYMKLAEQNRQAKNHLRKQWKTYGVSLPKTVCEFETPYCLSVKTDGNASINDTMLLQISNKIETISKEFDRWHRTFVEMYFCDFSFLLAAMIFGTAEAVRMKFRLVNEILSTGEKTALNTIINTLPDPFEELNTS